MKLRKQNFGTCLTVIQGIVVMCEVNVKILTEGIKLIVLEIIELLACPDGIDDVEMRGSYPVFSNVRVSTLQSKGALCATTSDSGVKKLSI